MTEIKGWHVFTGFAAAFGVIIAVNLTLAFQAVATFPGLEVRNSYVASQSFDANRKAQLALGWDVSAQLDGHVLSLVVLQGGEPIAPVIESATFGRATNVAFDETPVFEFDGTALRASVIAGEGNWNLRLRARAKDGTLFQQRIIVEVR
ncbi:MAG: FixH family protein [Paracoccaceae bacterium]